MKVLGAASGAENVPVTALRAGIHVSDSGKERRKGKGIMGWSKTSINGRVMWESPDGQRVADPADIPDHRKSPRTSAPTIYLEGSVTFFLGLVTGLIIGVVVGAVIW